MTQSKLENFNFQDDNETSKIEKFIKTLKYKIFNVQSLGLKYYLSSYSYEIILIPVLLFQLLSFSFNENVKLLLNKFIVY
jgi:hypothetical protein